MKSTLDCVTLHGGFVAVVEDGKRLREYPPARLDAPAPPKVCRKNHEQAVTIHFSLFIDKNNAFVLLKQLEYFTLRALLSLLSNVS